MPEVVLFHEPPDGGVAENVLQLATGLSGHGWTPTVAGPRDSAIRDAVIAAGVEHVDVPDLRRGYSRPDRDLRVVGSIRELLRRRRPAVVHCHSSKAGTVGRIAARLAGVPAVYSPHCFGFVGDVSAGRRVFAATVELALRPLTDTIICVCEDERRWALRLHLIAPVHARRVYNGVPDCPAATTAMDSELQAFTGDGLAVGAVAALREQKRLDVLIDAVPRILAEVPAARVVIVGDGPLRHQLGERATALGLDDEPRFAFMSFRRPSTRFLRGLDVFVLPSAWEAMPIAVLEALACGVPQVATATGGTPEAVSPATGTLVAPGDPAALGQAIVALLRDEPRRRAAAGASRARHAELFTLQRMVAETAAVYGRLAPEP
jgi:glycosyltransferase involved in cell wall biosynthesis